GGQLALLLIKRHRAFEQELDGVVELRQFLVRNVDRQLAVAQIREPQHPLGETFARAREAQGCANLLALDEAEPQQPLHRPADLRLVYADGARHVGGYERAGALEQKDDAAIELDQLVLARVGEFGAFADFAQNLPQLALNHVRWRLAGDLAGPGPRSQ